MGIEQHGPAGGRVAELAIALSLATDLGTGQPLEQGMQSCLLAVRTAEALGLDDAQVSTVYHTALLRFIGCTSDAAETAVVAGGDELDFNATMAPMLIAGSGAQLAHLVRHLGAGHPLHRRMVLVARAIAQPGAGHRSLSAHCDVAARLGVRLGLDPTVIEALAHAYERWDGKGAPAGLSGGEVPAAVRISTVARDAELWARAAGWPTAVEVLRSRSDRSYDPAVVDIVVDHGERWLTASGGDPCQEVLDAEPTPFATIDEADLDVALLAGLRRFEVAVVAWSLARRGSAGRRRGEHGRTRRRRRHDLSPGRTRPRPRPSRRAEWDLGATRSAHDGAVRARPDAHVPDRTDPRQVIAARSVPWRRRSPPRTCRRIGLSPR